MIQTLNLTNGFAPLDNVDSSLVEFSCIKFSGGEPHIRIKSRVVNDQKLVITTRMKTSDDVILVRLAADAIRRTGFNGALELFTPYFPAARQDRVCNEGESLSVKVYADIINGAKFDKVTILDPHSEVAPALIDNCEIISNHNFVRKCLDFSEPCEYNIVSPDAGANKKVTALCKHLAGVEADFDFNIVKCDKTRDTATGAISGFEVYPNSGLDGKSPVFIVDDICDGGGTFIGLAEELNKKGAGDLYLIVTHGIFSKGFVELAKYFKAIYTTDSWSSNYAMEIPEIEKKSEFCNIININEFVS